MTREQQDMISEKSRIYLPIGLALTVCAALFFGGWNLASLNNDFNTRISALEEGLERTVVNINSNRVIKMKLFCSELERKNPSVTCPDIDRIFKD